MSDTPSVPVVFAKGSRSSAVRRPPIGFHVTMRLDDDRPIATTTGAFRTVARVVLEKGECSGLLGFGCADNHIHAELATDRMSAGRFVRNVQCALVWRLGLGARFEPARIRPLKDQGHAYNAFHYVQRQDERHELGLDPFREATSIPDLLGLRVVSTSIIARVREHLPRVRRSGLVGQLPAGALEGERPLQLAVLADAAAAAFALCDLEGRAPAVVRARRAAIHAAGDVSSRVLSDALGLGQRTVQHLRAQPAEAHAVRAVTLQARLRAVGSWGSPREK